MPTFVSLINYTDKGIREISDSPKRLDLAKKILKDMGGEIKDFYLTDYSLTLNAKLEVLCSSNATLKVEGFYIKVTRL